MRERERETDRQTDRQRQIQIQINKKLYFYGFCLNLKCNISSFFEGLFADTFGSYNPASTWLGNAMHIISVVVLSFAPCTKKTIKSAQKLFQLMVTQSQAFIIGFCMKVSSNLSSACLRECGLISVVHMYENAV